MGSYLLITRELLTINLQTYTFSKSALKSASIGMQHDYFLSTLKNFLYKASDADEMPKFINFLLSKFDEFFFGYLSN